MGLRDDQRIKPAQDVLSRTLDDEAVLLDLNSGTYFGLNEVGTQVWELLGDGCTFGELRERLLERYEVDVETLQSDLAALVDKLHERGLVEIED